MSISKNLQKLHALYLQGSVDSFGHVSLLNGTKLYNGACKDQTFSLKENEIEEFIENLNPEETEYEEVFEKIGRLIENGRILLVAFAPLDRLIILDNERLVFDSTYGLFEFIKSLEEVLND